MARHYLTFDELLQLAMENYDNGGDGVVECWDERIFDEYVEEFGPFTKTKALKMFKINKACTDDIMGW